MEKFAKFLLVGVLNTLFGYGIYLLFLFLGCHYSVAAFMGTVLGVLFNFKTTGLLVFRNKNNKLIFNFVYVYVFGYIVNVLCLGIFNFFNINLYIAGGFLLLPMALLSFLLLKKFVFGEENVS